MNGLEIELSPLKDKLTSLLGMFMVILKFKFAIYPIVNDN